MIKPLSVLVLSLLTVSAASESLAQASEPTARIRVFNVAGGTIRFHHNKMCYEKSLMNGLIGKGVGVSNGWSRLRKNKSVGMPVAADTPEKFNEYVVPANEPITIEGMYYVSGSTGLGSYTGKCGPIGRYFTPQTGADYEAYIKPDGARCSLEIRQLLADQGAITTGPVHAVPAFPCRK